MNKLNMVTTYDIAKLAGVDQSTVSKVLSGATNFRQVTIDKIRNACQELGYVPNEAAKRFRSQTSRTIAVHIPFDSQTVLVDPFIPQFLIGVNAGAAAKGYSVLLSYAGSPVKQDFSTLVRSRQADGVIVTGVRHVDPRIDELAQLNIPCVLGQYYGKTGPKMGRVDIDNRYSGLLTGRYMASRGHRRVDLIVEQGGTVFGHEFVEGFYEGLAECDASDIETSIWRIPITADDAIRVTEDLFSRPVPPVAIGCNLSSSVFCIRKVIQDKGAKVDFLGCESPLARALWPDAPYLRIPGMQLGQRMADVLIDMLESGESPNTQSCEMLRATLVDEKGNVLWD